VPQDKGVDANFTPIRAGRRTRPRPSLDASPNRHALRAQDGVGLEDHLLDRIDALPLVALSRGTGTSTEWLGREAGQRINTSAADHRDDGQREDL
jgi:hypothetical protein